MAQHARARTTAVAIALPLALLGGLAATSARAAKSKPNDSIFFAKKHHAVTGILRDGVFTQKKEWRLKGHWTDAVATRDSLLLYDAPSGRIQTGTFKRGIYTKVQTGSTFSGLTSLAASCDSVILYDRTSAYSQTAKLKKGILTSEAVLPFGSGWDLISGSCDTLGFMHSNGALGASGTFSGGEYAYQIGYAPGLNVLTHFVSTTDSYLIYSSSQLAGEWGTATAGVDSGTSHAADFSAWDKLAATADTVLFYRNNGEAAVSTLKAGVYTFKGDLSLSAGWKIIAGSR